MLILCFFIKIYTSLVGTDGEVELLQVPENFLLLSTQMSVMFTGYKTDSRENHAVLFPLSTFQCLYFFTSIS